MSRVLPFCVLLLASVACAGQNYTVSVAELKVPDKARTAYEKAEAAFDQHKIGEAQRKIDKALQIFPRYTQALTLRGIIDLTQYQPAKAREPLEQAVQYDPSDGIALIALGATYNALARFDDALRILDRGLTLAPSNWQAHFETAKALLGKGQYQGSLREVDKARRLAPARFAATLHLVRAHALLGLKSYGPAATELEQYLGEEPNGPNSQEARRTLDQVRAFTADGQK